MLHPEDADPTLSSAALIPTAPSPAAPAAPAHPASASRKGFVRQGEDVTVAFGFILDEPTLKPWAEYYYELAYHVKLSSLPPEEAKKAYDFILFTAVNLLPNRVYRNVRGLPRLHRAILLLNPQPGKLRWLFVLRDNSSRPALDLEIDPEDIKKAAEVLKVGDQEPKWYRVLLYS
ncbi:hypothetical protein C8Q74DRAFT_1443915 [Fomes fomentarius]|nr:hypothetical protein C8Q74DRAFT_1443915 [Fomes fomentarius]